MEGFADSVLICCGHTFCHGCIGALLFLSLKYAALLHMAIGDLVDDFQADETDAGEHPRCPVCEEAIPNKEMIYAIATFEPSEAELKNHEIEMLDLDPTAQRQQPSPRHQNPPRAAARRWVQASDVPVEQGPAQDDSDYVVPEDESSESSTDDEVIRSSSRRRLSKNARGKQVARPVVLDSEEECENILFGAGTSSRSGESVVNQPAPDLVIMQSTKLKVQHSSIASITPADMLLVYDGVSRESQTSASGREGLCYLACHPHCSPYDFEL